MSTLKLSPNPTPYSSYYGSVSLRFPQSSNIEQGQYESLKTQSYLQEMAIVFLYEAGFIHSTNIVSRYWAPGTEGGAGHTEVNRPVKISLVELPVGPSQ